MNALSFLTPHSALPAFSPLHEDLERAGASFEARDGWLVASTIGERADEERALQETAGWADRSPLTKIELHAAHDLALGGAQRRGEDWWCPVTPDRTLVLAEPARAGALRAELEREFPGRSVDVTTQLGALLIAGPAARETIARFSALDLRPAVAPPPAFRPGSVARTPGAVLVESVDHHLVLFGAAVASYVWTVVCDAGARQGGRPVGTDAVRAEAAARA